MVQTVIIVVNDIKKIWRKSVENTTISCCQSMLFDSKTTSKRTTYLLRGIHTDRVLCILRARLDRFSAQ